MAAPGQARILVITAVVAERDAAATALTAAESVLGPYAALTATAPVGRVDLIAAGVGCAAAAAATASALAGARYALVVSAGLGGGFAPAEPGTSVVSSAVVHADLGAESAHGFLSADRLGLGDPRTDLSGELVAALAARMSARVGAVLTVSTVTGTAPTAVALHERVPDALAEGMEGAGVLAAARAYRVPFVELRAISNIIGPRDRAAWHVDPALTELARAITALCSRPLEGM